MKKDTKIFIGIWIVILVSIGIMFLTMYKPKSIDDENTQKLILNKDNKLELSQFRINFSNLETVQKIDLYSSEIEVELMSSTKTKMFGFNNQFPGPVFRGNVGDRFEINYTNYLEDESSVHWHGMQLSNEMDGVPAVTQTSVKSKESFQYNFNLNNPGIYWFHPHYNTAEQIEMGLYGYIVIDDPNIKIKSDIDNIYSLDDIRLETNAQISPSGSGHMDTMHGRYGNLILTNGQTSYDIDAKQGDLIRLRILNTANARFFNFGIEDQKLLVLGHDIGYVEKPYEVDYLTLAPGERYDILIYFNETTNKNILSPGYNENIKLGQLNSKGINSNSTETSQNSQFSEGLGILNSSNKIYYESLKEKILNPSLPDWSDKLEQEANFTLNLEGVGGMMSLDWTINKKTYPNNPEQLNLEEGKFYKIKYKNIQNVEHPMHLHGQKFLILSRNGVPVKEKGWKDTLIVEGLEEVEVGFIATNIGTWVNHCHILEHAEAGMLSFVNVK